MQPFISIIIVCYNYAKYLPTALNAISRQNFKDFEIVFVDNGCTDNSLEIMKAFEAEHTDISVRYVLIEKNIGLPYGDNKGVEAAKGKYLMFHDADDWMGDNCLELLAKSAMDNDSDRVVTAFNDVDENGKLLQVQELGEEPVYWLYGLVQGNLFRADLYRELGVKTKTRSPDIEKTFWFSSASSKVSFVHVPCYNMLIHSDSTSRMKEIYKTLLSDDGISLSYLLSICVPKLPSKDNSEYIMAVYALARLYYGHIFRFLRYAPLSDTFKIYGELHKMMKSKLPDYMECTNIALKNKKACRPYGWKVANIIYKAEKMHMMYVVLFFYHVLSFFVYLRE